jgi:hypothetical protein
MTKSSRAFYLATEKIRDFLLSLDNVNTVTFGDIREIDLNKQTIFPLAHVMVDSVALATGTMTFGITVLAMDVVHVNKGDVEDTDNTFYGLDNEQDVLNSMLVVVNLLNQSLTRSNLRADKFELIGQGTCEPFTDRFENKLAGWAYTFTAFVENDINICED